MTISDILTTTASPRDKSTRGLTVYLATAFAGAWSLWIVSAVLERHGVPGRALIPLLFVGSFAPFLASGLAVWRDGDTRGVLRFYARGLNWRMGWPVFTVSVFLTPLVGVAVVGVSSAMAGKPLSFLMGWKDVPYTYLFLLVLGGALAEEFGWSYLSDRLDERIGTFPANLVLGVIWSLWHLPLFFLVFQGPIQSYIPYPVFLITCVCYRFLMAWCYHRGGRNVLSNLLAHNGFNFALSLVPIVAPIHGAPQWRLLALGMLTGLSAALLYGLLPIAPRTLQIDGQAAA